MLLCLVVGVQLAPRPRLTTEAAYDEAWAAMLKALARALKPAQATTDPATLKKLDKKRRQLHRAVDATKALAAEDFYLLTESCVKAARGGREKGRQRVLWLRVEDYLEVSTQLP